MPEDQPHHSGGPNPSPNPPPPPSQATVQPYLPPPEEQLPPAERPVRSRRRRWVWISIVIAAVLLIVLLFVFTRPKSGSAAAGSAGGRRQMGPATITEAKAYTGNINIYVNALGTVTPTYTVTVYSQVNGTVESVHYREGQLVRKGDPLVDIDPRPYRATLTQAEGTLQHDEGLLAQAQMDLDRYRAAFAKNAISRQQVEDQEQLVKQYEGTVKADQGSVDYDRVQLGYCHIVAPISGRVGLRLVDPGNVIFSGSGSTLVVITQLQPITVVFNVSEDNLPKVQEQLNAHKTLTVDAFDRSNDKQIETGKLSAYDNQIDTTTGTVKFRAMFQNPGMELFPNQFVNARLLLNTLQNATLVSTAAIQHNGTATFVYVVKPGGGPAPAGNQPSNGEQSQTTAGNNAQRAPGGTTKNGALSSHEEEKNSGGSGQPHGQSATVTVQAVTVLTSNQNVTAVTGIGPGTPVATSGFDRLENGAHVSVQSKPPANTSTPSNNNSPASRGGASSPAQ